MNRPVAALLAALMLILALPTSAKAELPYRTYYFDSNLNDWLRIQAVYEPADTFAANFNEPVDVFVGAEDHIYVVDKADANIVVLDREGRMIRTIGDEEGEGKLSAPEGVFVTSDGTVYVADSGNQRIALFDRQGTFIKQYTKPDAAYLESMFFVPVKIIVDRRGVMYIALNSTYDGLLRMNPEGEFMGFFGANKAEQTFLNWMKRLILTKEQLAKEVAALPRPISNVAIDDEGFIYTATAGGWGQGAIRKLNAGGVDAFKNASFQNGHGIVDVAIDQNGFLYNVDLESASLNVYSKNGEALFSFGLIDNQTQQYGVIGYPTSIGVDSESNLWVADSRTKTVHKFQRTEFGNDVMTALFLYSNGQYAASKPYWERIYERNDAYKQLYQGLGKVYLQEENHTAALQHMKIGFDTEGYSKAFWQLRLEWLQEHFIALVIVLVAAAVLYSLLSKAYKRRFRDRTWYPPSWQNVMKDIKTFGFVVFHPYEGFYRIKEARVSNKVIIGIVVAAVVIKIMEVYYTGFLFNAVDLATVNIYGRLAFLFVPWITWILANYLVCSVKDGEGRFREVLQGSAYALAPYILFSIPIIIVSNLVSYDERVLYDSMVSIMYIWMAVLFIVMTQVIHNFDFIETLKNTGITVFAIFTIWLFAFIIAGLSYNFYDFFYQVYKEVNF